MHLTGKSKTMHLSYRTSISDMLWYLKMFAYKELFTDTITVYCQPRQWH